MANYKQLFTDFMDNREVRYTSMDDFVVRVSYGGDNLKSIPVYVSFDKDGQNLIKLFCSEVANFKDKEANGIWTCNQLNKRFRWVKFYIDDDSDLIVDCDAVVDESTCGEECMQLVLRMVNIIDTAYMDIMKAKLGMD